MYVAFYIVNLVLLAIFYLDNVIMWWESMLLVASYTLYLVFMKFNRQINTALKIQLVKETNTFEMISREDSTKVNTSIVTCNHALQGPIVFYISFFIFIFFKEYATEASEESQDTRKYGCSKKQEYVSLKWPDTQCNQATFLFLLPIIVLLWLTMREKM